MHPSADHTARILIADDEPLYLKTTGDLLRRAGYECHCVADAHAAIEALRTEAFDLILSDLNMPGNLRLELLHQGRTHWAHIPLIVVTGVPSLPTAIESLRLGIADYLLKPVKFEDLLASIERVLAHPRPKTTRTAEDNEDDLALRDKFPEIIGRSPVMLDLLDVIDRVTTSDANILITGESGTGKEVVAQAIHRRSDRAKYPFHVIDCTAIPEDLFESVLFGHARGAFTGAVETQEGLLARSHRGTAFLDELGELPMSSQAKLLRAIQSQTFTPIGKSEAVRIDTRFICATNRDLQAEVQAGRFRRDLYYRLGVIHIELPPLRERAEDIDLLAEHFFQKLRPASSPAQRISPEVLDCFRRYAWPGNIRELSNVVERALALARGEEIQLEDLPVALREAPAPRPAHVSVLAELSRGDALDSAEHSYLTALLEKHSGNISRAAQQADLSRQGMHKLLKKHGIAADDFRR